MAHAAVDTVDADETVIKSPETTQWSHRVVPWYKIGPLADEPKTAVEAAEMGGLNFTVSKRSLFYGAADASPVETQQLRHIKERSAIVRDDTEEWLGIMSKDYPLLQYGEAFDFMDQINPSYVAAGALKGGKQGFMVVQAPETVTVMNSFDSHEIFLVLRTSHDGSRAVEVMVMPLRDRCMNQLTLQSFKKGVEHRWAIKHTPTMMKKLADAQDSLGKLLTYAKHFEETAQRMIEIKIDAPTAKQLLQDSLPDRPKRDQQIDQIITTWHTADTVGKEFDWTGWGLLNAASDYFDWQRAGGSPESRFVGALQGQTYNAINRLAGRILSTL